MSDQANCKMQPSDLLIRLVVPYPHVRIHKLHIGGEHSDRLITLYQKVNKDAIDGKRKHAFIPRIQKTRLAEIEVNLKLLMAKGVKMKKSDASILATAPRVREVSATHLIRTLVY